LSALPVRVSCLCLILSNAIACQPVACFSPADLIQLQNNVAGKNRDELQ
jgi:hypothetical protein